MRSDKGYTGHGAATGGLQGHSVGDVYPYITYAQETPAGLRWGVINGATSIDQGAIFRTAAEAQRFAEQLKAGRA